MSRHQAVTVANAMFEEENNYEDPITVDNPRHAADEHIYNDGVTFKEPQVPDKKQTTALLYGKMQMTMVTFLVKMSEN